MHFKTRTSREPHLDVKAAGRGGGSRHEHVAAAKIAVDDALRDSLQWHMSFHGPLPMRR